MTAETKVSKDIEAILSHRHDNGADYWTTADENLGKGSPFSTLGSAQLLTELGVSSDDAVMQEVAKLIFSKLKEDGRFKELPKGAIYPCHTINCLQTLCQMGYGEDVRLAKTFAYLLETQEEDGGWRCKKFSYGRGEETNFPILSLH